MQTTQSSFDRLNPFLQPKSTSVLSAHSSGVFVPASHSLTTIGATMQPVDTRAHLNGISLPSLNDPNNDLSRLFLRGILQSQKNQVVQPYLHQHLIHHNQQSNPQNQNHLLSLYSLRKSIKIIQIGQ